jgi:Carboxypeptidase regulatory-like domain
MPLCQSSCRSLSGFFFGPDSLSRTFRLGVICLLVLGTCCLTTPVFAQSQASTGQIAGTVKDSAGAVIVGATIKAANTATGFTQTVTSGENGYYRIVLLPPGKYAVAIAQQGFAEAKAAVDVGVGRTTDLNVALNVGGRKEEVTVTAEMIEAQRHEEAAYVGATVVQNLPLNGRRFQDIVLTTPTAAIDPTRGGITLAGQKMVNTGSINVDGTDYGQLFFGGIKGGERAGFAPTIPLDSIQEFQIVRAGYTAEFGRSTGGTITAITKSGTNAVHGAAQYVIRPSGAGRSNDYFDAVRDSLPASCTTCVVNPNPTLHQWGGSIGGPVKKDKLFFFGSYDQQRQRLPHQIYFGNTRLITPSAATQEGFDLYNSFEEPFTQTNDAYLFLLKADYQLSNRHRLSIRYNHSNYEGQNANSVGTSLAPVLNSALSNNGTELDKTRTVAGTLASYFSHFANELRFQYARETRPRINNSDSPTVSLGSVGYFGSVSYLPTTEYDYRMQVADSITWIKGTHSYKFGGEVNHLYANQLFGFNQFGQYGYSGGSTASGVANTFAIVSNVVSDANTCGGNVCNPSGHRFDNSNAYYDKQVGNLFAAYSGDQIALFVQDSWRVRPTFTLNYGLRWEGELNPTPPSGSDTNSAAALVNGFVFPNGRTVNPTVTNNQLNQFAPRLGFAWNPKGDNKTVIRGFGGIYYAATPLLLYSNTMGDYRQPPANVSVVLPIPLPAGLVVTGPGGACPAPCNTVWKQLNYLAGVNLDNSPLSGLPVLSSDQINQIAQSIATATGTSPNPLAGANLITTANNFKNARSYQAGFGIERELSQGWTVALEGTWIKTVHVQRDLDLNLPNAVTVDAAGRPVYGLSTGTTRPIPTLGQVIIRDATAKGLYRGLTLRTTVNRKWGQINAYYTLSEDLTDDDNERDASGFRSMDNRNFAPDYGFSDQDRRHQFVAQPVFFLPWGMEISNAFRFLSGTPFNVTAGSDYNQDKANNDRPYSAVGVPFRRNAFRNRSQSYVDLRVQKSIKLTESKQIKLSAEMFNLFNSMNLQYASTQTNFCSKAVVTCGVPEFEGATGGWTANNLFMQLRNPTTGAILTTNTAGTPFEAQFTFKFIF